MSKKRVAWNKGLKGAQQNALKGKKMPIEWAAKAAEGRAGKCGGWNRGVTAKEVPNLLHGVRHHFWKGDKVGNKALHGWIRRQLGESLQCEKCGKVVERTTQIHWSNKSGMYLRDLNDWQRLCVPCHKKYDLERLNK